MLRVMNYKKYRNSAGSAIPPAGYEQIGKEGDIIMFQVPTDVAFGEGGYNFMKFGVTGSLTFNTATFGDPAPHYTKFAYAKKTVAATPTVATTINPATLQPVATTPAPAATTALPASTNKYLLYGGIGLAVVAAGYFIMKKMKKT
jgi:hypothetical protein